MPGGIKTNLLYSPVSYTKFLGVVVDDEYNLKEQFSEPPFKRVGVEALGNYAGFLLYFTHNRFNTHIDPSGELYYSKEKASITSYTIGISFRSPISFISNNLFCRFAFGYSSVDIWKKELEEKQGSMGVYLEAGLRYVFPSNSKYNLNVGVDFSHSESFSNFSSNYYDVIGINGIYPYVGIMW